MKAIPASSKSAFNRMLIHSQLPSNELLANSLSLINQALQKVRWHALEDKKAGWVDRVYRTMKVHLPYEGVYGSIVVAKDEASLVDQRLANVLYVFPVDSEERRLSQLMALAKRDEFSIKVMDGYVKAYPEQFDLLKDLAKEYRVRLESL